jgi:hypothetical protein
MDLIVLVQKEIIRIKETLIVNLGFLEKIML